MEKQVLNYRIIIEPEKMGRKVVYNAACPTLDVYDYGDSIDGALKSIKDGIKLAIECLRDEGQEIPVDNVEEGIVLTTKVTAPADVKLAIA